MELVLADDFTGAAEIAGIAARTGFETILTLQPFSPIAERRAIRVIDTNTRALPDAEAAARLAEICSRFPSPRPAALYKKIDSVLRGPVASEVEAVLDALDLRAAVVVPANPTRGRTIRKGRYYIDGVPLDETAFGRDPHHPATTSLVRERVGPSERLRLPDASSETDLVAIAAQLAPDELPVGGADFYRACRGIEDRPAGPESFSGKNRRLWLGGSQANREARDRHFASHGVRTIDLAPADDPDTVSKRAAASLAGGHSVALELPRAPHPSPAELETLLSRTAVMTIERVKPDVLLAEGGATARAVSEQAGWLEFSIAGELAPGVVALRPTSDRAAPLFVVKPGSYPWPDACFAP